VKVQAKFKRYHFGDSVGFKFMCKENIKEVLRKISIFFLKFMTVGRGPTALYITSQKFTG
jgi:hypothetical protein